MSIISKAGASPAKSNPRISVNKLGEYTQANPARRKRIVQDSKYPSKFIVARYRDARDYITDYIVSGFDESIIDKAVKDFKARKPSTDWQESDQIGSIDAVEAILDCNLPDLDGFTISANSDNILVNIKGVDVSVRPDIVLRGNFDGKKIVGAIKFHLVKTNPIDGEAGKTIATMLAHYVEKHLIGKKEICALDFCLSVDTFSKEIISAPTSFKRRMSHIDAACEEIALWWDRV